MKSMHECNIMAHAKRLVVTHAIINVPYSFIQFFLLDDMFIGEQYNKDQVGDSCNVQLYGSCMYTMMLWYKPNVKYV